MSIKTIQMEIALMQHFDIRRNLIVPNVTDMSGLVGFETDILILTKSGYATGVEIKVSKADLKNDLKKAHIRYLNSDWKSRFGNKSAKEIYYSNLKHFIYAVPEHLAEYAKTQIPEFCGLLVAKEVKNFSGQTMFDFDNAHKRAPELLYKKKWTPEMHYDLARLGAMRIKGLKQKIFELQNNKK